MALTSTDRIEKKVVLRAPRAKVWRALADAPQFGAWFGSRGDGIRTRLIRRWTTRGSR